MQDFLKVTLTHHYLLKTTMNLLMYFCPCSCCAANTQDRDKQAYLKKQCKEFYKQSNKVP